MKNSVIETKKEVEDYYKCNRCDINSLTKGSMCPCPRGGCEAKIVGTIVTTINREISNKLTKEQISWNKNR